MADIIKKYRIKEKLNSNDTLILHPETESSVVIHNGETLSSKLTEIDNEITNINTNIVTGVKGDSETSYRKGNVNITKANIGLGNVTNDAQVKRSEMGVASGVATLDTSGKVPSSQLPSYVDDVLEYASKSAFPTIGESGKIYVDKTTNITYRWSGSSYVEISPSLALGETSSTAYAGDKGKQNATNIATNATKIDNIINGTTVVGKATADENGDNIVNTYAKKDDIPAIPDLSVNTSGSGSFITKLQVSGHAITETKGNITNSDLPNSGIIAGTYSAIQVNSKGIATSGAQIIEIGTTANGSPSSSLAIGGLYFQLLE